MYIITGAAGFIGSHLAERFLSLGHDVAGVDCFTDYYSRKLKELNARDVQEKGGKILNLDLAKDDLSGALQNVDIVYHLAGQPGISDKVSFAEYVRNNILATHRLLEACRKINSLRGFIDISTSSVYGAHATDSEEAPPQPISHYGVTKLAAERLVLSYHWQNILPACSLRLFSVYGPRERPDKLYPKLVKSILEDKPFPLYEGSEHHLRSYTYVDDIMDGFVAVLNNLDKCLGEIFNIGTDKIMTTGRGIEIVEEIMNKKAILKTVPKRAGDQLKTHANIEKARRVLGYNPQVRPEDGLIREVEWAIGLGNR